MSNKMYNYLDRAAELIDSAKEEALKASLTSRERAKVINTAADRFTKLAQIERGGDDLEALRVMTQEIDSGSGLENAL